MKSRQDRKNRDAWDRLKKDPGAPSSEPGTDIKDLSREELDNMIDQSKYGSPGHNSLMREHKRRAWKPPQFYDEGPFADDAGGMSMSNTVAELNWSTHKAETFDDTGEKGLHPAWGLKSIIDRGVKPHEHPRGDKRIGEAENSTTKRDVPGKDFKSYSMVHAFEWSSPFSKLEPRGSNPLGGPIGGDPQPEAEEGADV
jgi:hypothetical protein